MLLQRLATGATGVKQARYRRGPTRGSEALVRACAVYTQPVCCVYGRSLALAVQCETTHGVYEFRRGFCTFSALFRNACKSGLRVGKCALFKFRGVLTEGFHVLSFVL